MKIFITGGTGFLGKRVVEKLASNGHQLLILSRNVRAALLVSGKRKNQISFLKSDLARPEKFQTAVKKFKPEVGIHLAWEGIPSDNGETNIRNLENGLRCVRLLAAAECKVFIGFGSCHEYGEPGVKVDERAPLNPYNTLYAAKTALYWLGSKIAVEQGMKMIWVRPFFIYGPGQREKALIPHLVNSIGKGDTVKLKNPRGGNDFIYVDDVAEAVRMIVRNCKSIPASVYNIGSGRLTSVAEMAREVCASFGKSPPLKIPKRIMGFYADISKIKKEIGWTPRVSLKEGVRKTIAYYQST